MSVSAGLSGMGSRYNIFNVCHGSSSVSIITTTGSTLCDLRREKRRDTNVAIGGSNRFAAIGRLNVISRVFAPGTLRGLPGNGVTINRIHCASSRSLSHTSGRPLIVQCVRNSVNVTDGNSVAGFGRVERRLRANNTIFRSGSGTRVVTCIVTAREYMASALRSTILSSVEGLGNTCSAMVYTPDHLVNFHSVRKFHPLYVNGLGGD